VGKREKAVIEQFQSIGVMYSDRGVLSGKRGNAVLVFEEDWNAISETLYLLSVLGMRGSIKEGMEQDLSECSKDLDW